MGETSDVCSLRGGEQGHFTYLYQRKTPPNFSPSRTLGPISEYYIFSGPPRLAEDIRPTIPYARASDHELLNLSQALQNGEQLSSLCYLCWKPLAPSRNAQGGSTTGALVRRVLG